MFAESEVTLVWEKRPTADEEQRARRLQLPPTFLCGVSSDSEAEAERPDDFNAELQKVLCVSDPHVAASPVCNTAPVLQVEPSRDAAAVDTSGAEERQTPIDLSTKRSSESDSSTAAGEMSLKGTVHQKKLILSFTQPVCSEHKGRYSEERL